MSSVSVLSRWSGVFIGMCGATQAVWAGVLITSYGPSSSEILAKLQHGGCEAVRTLQGVRIEALQRVELGRADTVRLHGSNGARFDYSPDRAFIQQMGLQVAPVMRELADRFAAYIGDPDKVLVCSGFGGAAVNNTHPSWRGGCYTAKPELFSCKL